MSWNNDDIKEMLEEVDDEKFEEAVRLRLGECSVSRQHFCSPFRALPYVVGAVCLLLMIFAATFNIMKQQRESMEPAATLSAADEAEEDLAGNSLESRRKRYQTCTTALTDLSSSDTFTRYQWSDFSILEVYVNEVLYEGEHRLVKCTVENIFRDSSGIEQGVCVNWDSLVGGSDGDLVVEEGMTLILPMYLTWNSNAMPGQEASAECVGELADCSLFYVFTDGSQDVILAAYVEDNVYDGMTKSAFLQRLEEKLLISSYTGQSKR